MRNLLIHVNADNQAAMKSAVAQAIALYRQEPVAIHLLNVQPQLSGHVAMCFDSRELSGIQHQAGTEDLAGARALLDAAAVPYTALVVVGRRAETIARIARELACDRILMGNEGHAGFAGRVFGSLAGQVRQIVGGAGDCQVISP
jgi:nucleotide-binding universal stress UspA family protein